MQQLEERNTYTPADIPHIRSNCDLSLNREETLGVPDLKTSFNNSDAALTGFRRSRAEPAGIRCKNVLSIESGTRQPIRYSATDNVVRRGTCGFRYPCTPRSIMKDNEDLEKLKDNLKLCYIQIAEQKMKIMDTIGFTYKGRHYVLARDE